MSGGAAPPGAQTQAGFRRPMDLRYLDFLAGLHAAVQMEWYLEIGCRSGHSLAPARCRTIGVDPAFALGAGIHGPKPELHLFQTTSDAFFASRFLERNGIRLSLSFIDGMHLIEYVLRDFMNLERASLPGGGILIHDCCPYTHEMTSRAIPAVMNRSWTGDVWKILPILARWRPDLRVTVLGCRPTGLALVTGLDPACDALSAAHADILAEFGDTSLEDYGTARFFDEFDYVPVADVVSGGYALLDGIRLGR